MVAVSASFAMPPAGQTGAQGKSFGASLAILGDWEATVHAPRAGSRESPGLAECISAQRNRRESSCGRDSYQYPAPRTTTGRMSGYAIVQPDLHWLPARGADDGEFSKRDSGAELAIRKVTDNASLGIATSCPTDQRIFSKPSRVSSPTAVKPPTSVRPRTTSSLCRPPTPSRLARRFIQNDAGTSLVQTMETRGHQPIPCSFVPRLHRRHQSATGTTQSNT